VLATVVIINNTCCYIYKRHFVHTMHLWFLLVMQSRAIIYMGRFNGHDVHCVDR